MNKKDMIKIGSYSFDTTRDISRIQTFDLKIYNNYKDISIDNIYLIINSVAPAGGPTGTTSTDFVNLEKSYNSEKGILTITAPKMYYNNVGVWLNISVYIYD